MRDSRSRHTKAANKAFGGRLKEAIKSSNYGTKTALAEKTGSNVFRVYRHCLGKCMPWSEDTYEKYAKTLGVRTHWLKTGEGPMLNFDDPEEDDCIHQEQTPLDRALLINIAKALVPEDAGIDTEELMTAIASIYDSVNSKNVSPEMKTILLDTTIQAVKQVQEKQADQEPH